MKYGEINQKMIDDAIFKQGQKQQQKESSPKKSKEI